MGEYETIKKYYPQLSDKDIQFIIDNPCIDDRDKDGSCSSYPKCGGCLRLNGFVLARIKPLENKDVNNGVPHWVPGQGLERR